MHNPFHKTAKCRKVNPRQECSSQKQRKKKSRKTRNPRNGNSSILSPFDQSYWSLIHQAMEASRPKSFDLLHGYIRNRNVIGLLNWASGISPQLYGDSASYFADNQIAALIKKVPFPKKYYNVDTQEAAREKFLSAEERCQSFNRTGEVPLSLLHYAREYIRRVIGETPPIKGILLDDCSLSSGASRGVHGNKTNYARKLLASSWTVTPSAKDYALYSLWHNEQVRPLLGKVGNRIFPLQSDLEIVPSNLISYVPKTASTDRTITVEPLLNSYLQKGVDKFLRRKLKGVAHIDLSDQTRNQEMARKGSLPSEQDPYCTIDLESASDSLSIKIVKQLLPRDWFSFLDEIRSPSYSLGGETHRFEKFCSMGNGFCFPLESLIFSAITYAAHYRRAQAIPDLRNRKFPLSSRYVDFSVYGDDIIVRQSSFTNVVEDLELCGFIINKSKTFGDGPFRESCGADWFEGQDVRPVYLTRWIRSVPEVYALHNSFLRSRVCEIWSSDLLSWLRSLVPKRALLVRPGREPGDCAFSVPLDLAMIHQNVFFNRKTFCWSWKELIALPVRDDDVYEHNGIASAMSYALLQGAKPGKEFVLRYSSTRREVNICRWYSDNYHNTSFESTVASPQV